MVLGEVHVHVQVKLIDFQNFFLGLPGKSTLEKTIPPKVGPLSMELLIFKVENYR